MKGIEKRVIDVINSCETAAQLNSAEKYMILAGVDATKLIEEQRQKRQAKGKLINKMINDNFNKLAK
jgi:hypothetical protein|tara:strand:- start:144 stop:344 length:201 start_codon:yes stop_codon:yes gene_type:complete